MQLSQARKKIGLSQEALGKVIGVGQAHICNIESGKIYPTAVQAIQINQAVKQVINWQKHPNAPLTNREESLLAQLYERGVSIFGSEKECSDFLSVQSNASLRKMFKLAGVDKIVEPMKANGFPEIKRRK